MSGVRAGLAALDDAALEAAASKGLLRRAHRDREAGLAAIVAEDADTVTLSVDGETVRLRAGGLKAASCTCPAQALCRHTLAAVLLLRDEPAPAGEAADAAPETPADPLAEIAAFSAADLVKAFGRAGLREAEALLAAATEGAGEVAFETVQRACVVRLPGGWEVRYLAGLGLDGMIAKQAAGSGGKAPSAKTLHAAALLAVRRLRAGEALHAPKPEQADPSETGADAPPVPDRAAETAFLDTVEAALNEAARSALATAPLLLEERLLDLALSSRADALPRLAAALRSIAEDFSRRRERAGLFEPDQALAAIARTAALVRALRRHGDDPALRGAVRQPYSELGALDLVGCGVELWSTPTGARGASAHCLAPESGRWFSLTLARAADQDPHFSPAFAARNEAVFGETLLAIGRGGFGLDAARATAEGRLSLGGQTRLTWSEARWAALLAGRPELFVERWRDLSVRLAPAFSPSLRAPHGAAPVLLRPKALAPIQFDAVDQRAWLPAQDADGAWLDLTIRLDAGEARLDALAALQSTGTPALLAALATREGADLVLSPFAALARPDGAFDAFDLPARETPAPPSTSLLARLRRGVGEGLAGLSERFGRGGPSFARLARPDAASAALLALAGDHVLALAELGGRMEDRARLDRLAGLAARLETAGLEPLGRLLAALARADAPERPARLVAFVHASACHAALSPRPPLVVRMR